MEVGHGGLYRVEKVFRKQGKLQNGSLILSVKLMYSLEHGGSNSWPNFLESLFQEYR